MGRRYKSKGEQLRAKRAREYERKAAEAARKRAEVLEMVRSATNSHYEAVQMLNKLNFGNAIDQLDGLKLSKPAERSEAMPGTLERIEDYRARYDRGEELWSCDDWTNDDDEWRAPNDVTD